MNLNSPVAHTLTLNKFIGLLIVVAICGYMSVRGLMNSVLILLFLISVLYTAISRHYLYSKTQTSTLKWMSVFLAAPFTAVLIAQSLRMHYDWQEFDAPLRMLCSIPVMWLLYWRKIQFTRLLFYSVPLSLLILVVIMNLNPAPLANWGGRFSTYFADCDTFGVYGMVLLALCLFFPYSRQHNFLSAWNIAGVILGLYLVIGSQTRTAWLNIPFLVAVWLYFNFQKLKFGRFFKLFVATTVILFAISQLSMTSTRITSGHTELIGWFSGNNTNTSAGQRLTMWQMSWELIKRNPILGYGDYDYMSFMNEPWITSISSPADRTIITVGPHNEFLASLLRSGIFGGIAVLLKLCGPLIVFWQKRNTGTVEIDEAARLGVAVIICLIVSSLGFEVLTLKYTASFFGLIIAGLTAQIAWAQDNTFALNREF